MKKRVLSILLVFSMILAMFPVNAMAADNRFAEKVRDEDIIEYIYINYWLS